MAEDGKTASQPEGGPPGPGAPLEPMSPSEAVRALSGMPSPGHSPDAKTVITEPPALIGRTLGQYRVTAKIGQGGMGAVFKAYDTALGRDVALKVLFVSPLDDPRMAERFQREARCLARLSHPNLLHVYNVGADGNLHYFAMELLDGKTLFQVLQECKRLPAAEVVVLAGQLLSALHYIHKQGITHRDLKTGNIMLCGSRAVLMDFGLAKEEQLSGLTSAGVVLGTPDYMAPEQAEGRTSGPATDIYSLGVLLFEALAGRLPFIGRSALSIIRQHLDTPAPALEAVVPGVDPRLAAAVARCLAKAPKDRYPSCVALAADLLAIQPTAELAQLVQEAGPHETLAGAVPALIRPTLPLAASAVVFPPPAPAAARSHWLWIGLGFVGVLILGLVLLLGFGPRGRPRPSLAGTGHRAKVLDGDHKGQEIWWEFHSKGPNPADWTHTVEVWNERTRKWESRTLTHDQFLKEYKKLSLEGPAKP